MALLLILIVAGGVSLVLYGLELTSGGLKEAAGGQLRTVLTVLTNNRLTGLAAGVIISFLLSSSSVATVLLIDLAAAGYLALQQAIGVVLGCAIGSTLTVQLISFASRTTGSSTVTAVTALVMTVGFLVRALARYRRTKALGSALLGLGLLFLGLKLLGEGFAQLAQDDFLQTITVILQNPLAGLLAGVILGALVRSVAACGLVIVLVANGFELSAAIPVILGANVGACLLPLVVGIRSSRNSGLMNSSADDSSAGLQVALAALGIKLVGALGLLMFLGPFETVVARLTDMLNFGVGDMPGRQVAHAHMLFNLTNTLIFLPLAAPFAALLRKLVPAPRAHAAKSALLFVNPSGKQDAEMSLQQAHLEVHRMGVMADRLLERAFAAVLTNSQGVLDRVEADDEKLDLLDTVLTAYLVRLSVGRFELTGSQIEMRSKLLGLVKNLESLGDQATRGLVVAGRRKAMAGLDFTPEATADLTEMYQHLEFGLGEMLSFLRKGRGDIEAVLAFEREIDPFKRKLHARHVGRICDNVPGEVQTGDTFINVLDTLRVAHYYVAEAIRILTWHM